MTTSPRITFPFFQAGDNRIYAQAIVTVKKASDSSKATLYAARTGTAALLNPQTLTADGKWAQAVYFDVPAFCSIDAIHLPDHDTAILSPAAYQAHYGTTAQRPTLTATDIGYRYTDTTIAKQIFWNGTAWKDAQGAAP